MRIIRSLLAIIALVIGGLAVAPNAQAIPAKPGIAASWTSDHCSVEKPIQGGSAYACTRWWHSTNGAGTPVAKPQNCWVIWNSGGYGPGLEWKNTYGVSGNSPLIYDYTQRYVTVPNIDWNCSDIFDSLGVDTPGNLYTNYYVIPNGGSTSVAFTVYN